MSQPVVITIAATDGSGHAGLLADLRVHADLNVHGAAVVTGITCQNSQAFLGVEPQEVTALEQQWLALKDDLAASAIKIGMLLTAEQMHWAASAVKASSAVIVWDPVLSSSVASADNAMPAQWREAAQALIAECDLVTPNLPEAEVLLETTLDSTQSIEQAALQLRALGAKAVLIKGGHAESSERVADYFHSDVFSGWISQPRINTDNSRGTGCVLASAVAAFIAQGRPMADAVVLANAYVHRGLEHGFAVGQGNGLLANRGWPMDFKDFPAVSDKAGYSVPEAFADCGSLSLGLYPVVDTVEWIEKLLPLGVETIQLRVKDKSPEFLDDAVKKATELAKQYNARLFINDYWQLAIKHGSYGVHLGQEDLETADINAIKDAGIRLGLSTHSEYEWARAAAVKPSYLAMGAVFPTDTKPVEVIGEANLQRWTKTLQRDFPLTAIGGINNSNIDRIIKTGVGSIALVSAITKADDYQLATKTLLGKFDA